MTPAENFHKPSTSVYQIKMQGSPTNVRYTSGSEWKVRPSSGSSPLRPDGTRPPRGWDHSWGNIHSSPSTTVTTSQYTRIEGSVPLWDSTGVNILSSMGRGWLYPGQPGWFPTSVRSAARTKFLNKLSDRKADWGQTMGEAKKTVEGLTDLAHRLLNGVDTLAKYYRMERRAVARVLSGKSPGPVPNYKGDLARVVKDIPSAWLATQFGIKPLLRDIQDSAVAVDHLLFGEKHIPKMIVRAGHSQKSFETSRALGLWAPGPANKLRIGFEDACHLSATYEVPVSSERRMQQLGLGNPYAVAWELAPWSWAADYGSDLGDWINSLFARDGVKFIEGSETLLMKFGSDAGGFSVELGTQPGVSFETKPSVKGVICQGGRMRREVLTGTPSPWFPTFRNKLGLNQLANLMSAISQMRK